LIDFRHTHTHPKPLVPKYTYQPLFGKRFCQRPKIRAASLRLSGNAPRYYEEQAKREFILGAPVALSALWTGRHNVWVLLRRLNSSYRRSIGRPSTLTLARRKPCNRKNPIACFFKAGANGAGPQAQFAHHGRAWARAGNCGAL
jgi:hypothetical protein